MKRVLLVWILGSSYLLQCLVWFGLFDALAGYQLLSAALWLVNLLLPIAVIRSWDTAGMMAEH